MERGWISAHYILMRWILNVLIPQLFSRLQEVRSKIQHSLLIQYDAKRKQNEHISACFNAVLCPAVPLGYEDKARESNCFLLLMNDDEYTWVYKCVCVFVRIRVKCLKLVAATNECLGGGYEPLRSSLIEFFHQLEFLLCESLPVLNFTMCECGFQTCCSEQ